MVWHQPPSIDCCGKSWLSGTLLSQRSVQSYVETTILGGESAIDAALKNDRLECFLFPRDGIWYPETKTSGSKTLQILPKEERNEYSRVGREDACLQYSQVPKKSEKPARRPRASRSNMRINFRRSFGAMSR